MILAYDALLVYLFKNTFDLLSLSSTVVEYLQTFLPTKTERKKVFFSTYSRARTTLLLWTVVFEEKLQPCSELRDFQSPFCHILQTLNKI